MTRTITIVTCDRKPSYLKETVLTIPTNYKIQYIAQGEIELPRKGDFISVEKKYIDDKTRHRDAQFNYANALLNTVDGLIIEDDVKLCKDFDKYLKKIKSQIPTKRYAVALYSLYKWNNNDDLLITKYPVSSFYATQGMLYDIETSRKFGKYILENIGKEPYDMALKTYIKKIEPEISLFATKNSLVQHIGDQGTGLGNKHRACNFIDDVNNKIT